MSYKVTVRRGPKIKHDRYDTLDQALAAVERHAYGGTRPVEALGRRTSPAPSRLRGSSSRAQSSAPGST